MRELDRFPDGFLWGAATSSHQVEGSQPGSDWTDWESEAGRIHDGTRSGDACGWWTGQAEADLDRAAALGLTAIRISLEWSRLEPSQGVWDMPAFERYAVILDRAQSLGLHPFITLNHFTLPRWFAARGSWLDPDSPSTFAAYAMKVARVLGARPAHWATLNEPSVLAFMGYLGKAWPPGQGSPVAAYTALRNMLLAHARGRAVFREVRPEAKVGLVLNCPAFDPARPEKRRDRVVAAAQDWAFTGCVLHALMRGRFVPPLYPSSLAAPELQGALDWVGINYYGRFRVRFDANAPAELFGRRLADRTIHTEHNDWGEVHPEGLTRNLERLSALGVPVHVTENGMYTHDDEARAQYVEDHIRAVHAAITRGADVRSYQVWSLVDNFEWAEGWLTPFGLFALDRETQARTPRPSAARYARICADHGLPPL